MLTSKHKIVLCATNTSLTVGVWQGSKLQQHVVFQNTDQDHTAFSQYLSQHPDVDLYLLVDAIEEDYRLETMPHTAGNARREMIERKLNQFNRNSQFRAAHFINRAEDKRRDDNFLFIALNNSDFLQGWLNVIRSNQAPLVGVYMLSMLSQVIVRQMKLLAPNILLCERLSSGLRQTYLHNGRLRMSRSVPMAAVKQNQWAYFYLVELEKTRLYLLSQRLIAADTALQMVLPALDAKVDEVAKSISQDQGIGCKTVDILTFAKNIGLDPDLVKVHPELVQMQLLASGNVPDNLAPVELTKAHSLNKLRSGILLATLLAVLGGLALVAYYVWSGYHQKNQLAALVAETQQQQSLYDEVAKNFPTTPIPSDQLKIAADLAQSIKKNDRTPRELMQVLSVAITELPEISLNRIRWVQSPQVEFKDEQDVAASLPESDSVVGEGTKLLQIGFVNAEIKGFNGDYRAALNTLSQLVVRLREDKKVDQVVILQEPINVSSLSDLSGSTTDENTAERTPAIFKLKIILKPDDLATETGGKQ
ncbi:MAG TPA: hypothetical protein PLR90_04690 [Methylophilus sp.]|nr:hypothetical protein [Methylophilus sp.]HQQ33195.1 hypothetical protein [Methylophilus sp.]